MITHSILTVVVWIRNRAKVTQENRQLTADCHFHFECCKERWLVWCVIITDYCKVVRVQSQNQEKNKKQSSSNAVINIIHVPCYRSQKANKYCCNYFQQASVNNVLTEPPRPWEDCADSRIRVYSSLQLSVSRNGVCSSVYSASRSIRNWWGAMILEAK